MITVSTAEKALKTVYLGVIGNQLNYGANPLLSKIKQTTNNVYGNEIVKSLSYGISGGVTAAAEADELPGGYGRTFLQLKGTLKNLYGTLEISDKAIRCSQNSAGAFVNLLNDEMETLIKSSTYNLGRMLYGNGSGILGQVAASNEVAGQEIVVDSLRNFAPNQVIRMVNSNAYTTYDPMVITLIDRSTNTISINRYADRDFKGYYIASLKGLNNEITGVGALFDSKINTIYGIRKDVYPWIKPYSKDSVGAISELVIQSAIDEIEEVTGTEVDFISCSAGVRRAYQECMSTMRRNIDVMNLDGGFRALSYNGIPLIADKFVADDEMLLLNTKEFELCQLGDWQWLEGNDGKIIKQKDNYPVYSATLVKYAELICNKPSLQVKSLILVPF